MSNSIITIDDIELEKRFARMSALEAKVKELGDRANEEIRCLEFYKLGRDPAIKRLTPHGEGQLSAWETVRRLLNKQEPTNE